MHTLAHLETTYPTLAKRTPSQPVWLTAGTLVSALGAGKDITLKALREQRSGLRPCDFAEARLETWTGRVQGLEEHPLTGEFSRYDSRNNRLALMCLEQDGFMASVAAARVRYGAHRIAVLFGTSTSGILETERAYRHRDPETGTLPADFSYRHTHNNFAGADFVRRRLGLKGPALAISTACSSGAKVFSSAARLLAAGICDAVVAAGVDSLCLTTLHGFSALGLVSREPCRPADDARNGISIGEGAGFALLERSPTMTGESLALLGYGESSDAYHMSTPHPEGLGAILAMAGALLRAGVEPDAIDHVLLHGTATRVNDSTEDMAVCRVLGSTTPCSSIKGWTGHTLGAAGMINVLVAGLCIEHGFAPPSLNTRNVDPGFGSHILTREWRAPIRHVLCNAFGFGGNNSSLLLGRASPC